MGAQIQIRQLLEIFSTTLLVVLRSESSLKKTGVLNNITWHVSGTSGSDYGFTVDVYLVKETPDGTVGEGTLIKSGYDPAFSTGDQTIDVKNTSVEKGTDYTVEFVTSGSDNDGSGDYLSLSLDDSASSAWFGTSDGGASNYYGDATFGISATNPSSAEYISANHSVSDAEEAAINITESSNVSADLTAEYYDGNAWQTGETTTVTSTGNHTLALPAVSSSKWRVQVDVTKNESQSKIHTSR